jgi:hypothetical protein
MREKERQRQRFLVDYNLTVGAARKEGEAIGVAKGKAEGEAIGKVLAILEVRFNKIPKETENAIRSMVDPTALESLAAHAATCRSLDEFEKALG